MDSGTPFGRAILILRVSQSCASSSLTLARLTLGSDQIPPSGVCKREIRYVLSAYKAAKILIIIFTIVSRKRCGLHYARSGVQNLFAFYPQLRLVFATLASLTVG